MGISYSSAAVKVLEKWTAACLQSTNSQNTFTVKDKTYFWEPSVREHKDGAVTGNIFRVIDLNVDGRELVRPASAFRINADGSVTRAPKFLREAAVNTEVALVNTATI